MGVKARHDSTGAVGDATVLGCASQLSPPRRHRGSERHCFGTIVWESLRGVRVRGWKEVPRRGQRGTWHGSAILHLSAAPQEIVV